MTDYDSILYAPWFRHADECEAYGDRWAVAFHDFWAQVAIVALLHYGATFGGLEGCDAP